MRHRICTTISIAAFAATIAGPAYANSDNEDDQAIVVTANREPQPLDRVGQSVTLIDVMPSSITGRSLPPSSSRSP